MGIGPWQILLIVVVILVLFGGKKIPELARGLAEGIKEFKKASSDIKEEVSKAVETDTEKDNK